MPYEAYWQRLEEAYRVGALPSKAAREARLAEIRSVPRTAAPHHGSRGRSGAVVRADQAALRVLRKVSATTAVSTAKHTLPTNAAVYPDSNTFVLHGPGFEHRARLGDPVEYWEAL